MIFCITFTADTQREPQTHQADRKFKIALKVESADVFSKLHTEIHIKNEEPVLRTKIGSEHSYPILATDLVSDNKVYAVTINIIDGTERRIFEAGCRYDARSYISEFIDKFCVPTLGVEDYGRFENLITQSIKAIT